MLCSTSLGTDQSTQNMHSQNINKENKKLEKATGQVLPSAKYRPARLVVDAALRSICSVFTLPDAFTVTDIEDFITYLCRLA